MKAFKVRKLTGYLDGKKFSSLTTGGNGKTTVMSGILHFDGFFFLGVRFDVRIDLAIL